MLNTDIPTKPRRKYLEVPVHKAERDQHKIKKTYSANFSARKQRNKHIDVESPQKISEVIIEIPEKDPSSKISKKILHKEIERLAKDNEEITLKFNELESLSVKKILKLKEKIINLQDINSDIIHDSEAIKHQYSELQKCYEAAYKQLELSKVCKKCEEFRDHIEKITQENTLLRKRNGEVNEDLGMLKTVVFRLNVQLERYQDKLRKHNININKYSHLHSQKSSNTQLKEDEIINIL